MSRPMARFGPLLRMTVTLLLVVFLAGASAAGAGAAERVVPVPDVATFTDPSAAMTLADILAGGQEDAFVPAPDQAIRSQFTTAAVWMRVRVAAPEAMTLLLSLTPNFIDLIDVYVADEKPGLSAADFSHHALGAYRPLDPSGYSGVDEVVPLELGAGEPKIVYIRTEAPDVALLMNMRLFFPEQHVLWDARVRTAAGLLFGAMALLAVTQLVLYQFVRVPLYLMLAGMTLAALTYQMSNAGYSRLLLFPDGGIGNSIFLSVSASLGVVTGALAGMQAFEAARKRGLIYWFFWLIVVAGVLCSIAPFFGLNLHAAPLRNLIVLLVTTAMAIYSVAVIERGNVATYLRAAAFMVLWLGLTPMLFYYWGLFGLPTWSAAGYAVACLFEVLLLTAMLGWRVRMTALQNSELQQEALSAALGAELRAVEIARERTRELAEAKQTAEAALAAEMDQKDVQVRFMEVISHQYRTPLATIRSNVDTIALSLPENDHPNRERITRIRRGISRLIEVLEVNLARSRIQGSALEPEFRRVRVGVLVADVGRRALELMPDADIIVSVTPEAETAEIRADAHMLGLALINLLENAVKYSTPAGSKPVLFSASLSEDAVILAIEDQGIGIPAGEIEGVLANRVRGTNAARIAGTGLGLSMVSRVATAHRGTFKLESVENIGTTAILSFFIS